ncbi:MAG TPA: efflux RND transporter periplasmic adaptor subunit [Steroidobacteraceae bacterium]|nr:efflux RND transporter periplasmic adaptor subunit [Steroidobacteraceae bacterium]
MTPDLIEQPTLDRESSPTTGARHSPEAIRRRRLIWLAGLAVLIALMVWVIHHRLASHAAKPSFAAMMGGPLPVSVDKVSTANVPVVVDALGTVTPLSTVTVRPQVTGPIVKIAFKEGQMIAKGGLLAQVDPRPYQAALDQAIAQLGRDQAALAGARTDLVRYKQLLAQNSVAQQTYSDELATVHQNEAAVEADKAAIETARLNLSYTRITSPVAGLVGLRQVDLGNLVQENQTTPIVTVTQMQPMSVLFTVPENDLSQILERARGGRKLAVEAWDQRSQHLIATGTLASIDNQINVSTGTLQLRALFDNSDSKLFPNEFVNVKLVLDTLQNQIVVPGAAVQNGPSSNFVYVVKPDHTVSMRTVTTGPTDGNDIAILKGLTPGETVVTDGADQLRDGAKVLLPGETPPAFAKGASALAGGSSSARCARIGSLMKSATGTKAEHLSKVYARLGCGGSPAPAQPGPAS